MKLAFSFFWVVLVATLFSCSNSFHCRKCFNGAQVKRDTLTVLDTVRIASVKMDTVVQYDLSTDTLVITKERLTIKYKKLPGDTIFLAGECAPDSVIVEKKVPYEKEIKVGLGFWQVAGICFLVLVAGVLVGKFLT